jgi:acyl-CoA thioester hydrolase
VLGDFKLVRRFRVPFEDVDMLRHVNHIAPVRWAETIRCEYVADVLGEAITGTQGVIGVRIQFDYESQMDYREDVAIGCRVARIGGKSLEHLYEVWSETRGIRCVRGTSVVVAFDYARNTSISVPEVWRERILAFEAPHAAIAGHAAG